MDQIGGSCKTKAHLASAGCCCTHVGMDQIIGSCQTSAHLAMLIHKLMCDLRTLGRFLTENAAHQQAFMNV